jgi:RNA polymerase sigma-70 factor (ECF subfamily)
MPDRPAALFQEVYRDHAGLLARVARGFTDSGADRDDLLQDILVALWQALPHFKGQAKLSTYVYRVAHSTALNWKRSRQRYRQKVERFALAPADADEPGSPDRERLEWLYARIRELSPADRSLIMLHLDQVPYADIADITGLTESNVGVRLHRIKPQLSAQAATSP